MERRKRMDIEDLLVWAYRDQKVGAVLGGGPRIKPVPGAPEPEPMGRSADGVLTMERIGALGCVVRGGGGAWGGSAEVARDAEVVFRAVEDLVGGEAPVLRALLRRHAEAGTAPDWVPQPRPRCFALRGTYVDGRGLRQANELVSDRASGLGDRPCWAEVGYRDTPEQVAEKRRIYLAWWEGLHVLAAYFQTYPTLLQAYVVTGPSRPVAPWQNKNVLDKAG